MIGLVVFVLLGLDRLRFGRLFWICGFDLFACG